MAGLAEVAPALFSTRMKSYLKPGSRVLAVTSPSKTLSAAAVSRPTTRYAVAILSSRSEQREAVNLQRFCSLPEPDDGVGDITQFWLQAHLIAVDTSGGPGLQGGELWLGTGGADVVELDLPAGVGVRDPHCGGT